MEGYVSVKTLVCPGISGGIPGVPSVPSSPGPAIPGKKGELHYPAGLPPPSFLSCLCTWPEGEAGPGRHSPTFSFPVSVQGSFFFLPLLPPSACPSLPVSPPSLPPFPTGSVRWGAESPHGWDAPNSQQESALWSLVPPFPFPAPFPHPRRGLSAAAGGTPEVSIPCPPSSFSHLGLRVDSGTREEGYMTCS